MSPQPDACLSLGVALEIMALADAQRRLAAYLVDGGCAADVCFRAELVVEEVVMNLIRHAKPLGASRAVLSARCCCGGAQVVIGDDGAAFDPLAATARPMAAALLGSHDGGFGLHLIRRQADAARYARTDAANRLELDFIARK